MCKCEAIAQTCFISSFFAQPQTTFGCGARKGQPEPNLWNGRKIAVAALLFHGCLNAHRARSQVAVSSEPGEFRAGDQGGAFGLCTAVSVVIILEMADSCGCARKKKAVLGFQDCHHKIN